MARRSGPSTEEVMRSEPATGNGSANRRLAKTQDAIFRAALTHAGLPQPDSEVKFHPTRKWLFDYAFREAMLAVEVEGGVFVMKRGKRGAHGSVKGILRDMEKYSEAAAMGWRIIRVLPARLCTKATTDLIRRALAWGRAVSTTEAK